MKKQLFVNYSKDVQIFKYPIPLFRIKNSQSY